MMGDGRMLQDEFRVKKRTNCSCKSFSYRLNVLFYLVGFLLVEVVKTKSFGNGMKHQIKQGGPF